MASMWDDNHPALSHPSYINEMYEWLNEMTPNWQLAFEFRNSIVFATNDHLLLFKLTYGDGERQ